MHFNVKPDYASLLSKKFSSFLEAEALEPEEQPVVATDQDKQKDSDQKATKKTNQDDAASNSDEEEDSVPSLARGRKLSEAACLRITRIEKVLATRNDLSVAERRSLRARKNTANFRERRKIASELKQFQTVELDAILNTVSPSAFSIGARSVKIRHFFIFLIKLLCDVSFLPFLLC